jgi:hypothetical protein
MWLLGLAATRQSQSQVSRLMLMLAVGFAFWSDESQRRHAFYRHAALLSKAKNPRAVARADHAFFALT